MTDALEISLLARLLETGEAKAGVRNRDLIQRLITACWIEPTLRRSIWAARPAAYVSMKERLAVLLPTWEQDFALLRRIDHSPFEPSDIAALPMLRRQISVTAEMINRRNWKAAAGLGPKHLAKLAAPALLTKDWVLRFRPNEGLAGIGEDGTLLDFTERARREYECAIPERGWMKVRGLCHIMPELVITCENIGAYIDLPVDSATLVIYAPGADIEAAVSLLRMLPKTPWLHFGDLDQEGVLIGHSMAAALGREVQLLVPSFAPDYLDAARPVKTAWGTEPTMPLFAQLRKNRKRIFQEVFMLDARLRTEIAEILAKLKDAS
jgi:hypothetical protein